MSNSLKLDKSNSAMKSETIKIQEKIEEKQINILETLKETKNLSNLIGNELNSNTESFERINDELDILGHNLKISEYLTKKFSSWFYFLTPTKTFEPYKKNKKNNKKTIFEETQPDNNKSDFYDNVASYLDCLQKDSETFGKILKEQKESIDIIEKKTEKSDGKIKKTIHKVKNC